MQDQGNVIAYYQLYYDVRHDLKNDLFSISNLRNKRVMKINVEL